MNTTIIRLYLLLVLTGGWLGANANSTDPQQMMRDVTDSILERLDASPQLREDRAALVQLIEEQVFPVVDFDRVARLILGKHWPAASQAQRARFIDALQIRLACIYSTAFASYTDQSVDYLQPRRSDDGRYVEVRARILESGRQPVAVNYRLLKTDSTWKIYDLVVEGVSLVMNYRASFRQILRQQDLDALIADLQARNAKGCNNGS